MEAYRYKNLVYIPLPKHASRSYICLFKDVLKWEPTESYFINWGEDCVFAHLKDPMSRHASGIAEFLVRRNLTHLIDSPDFINIFGSIMFFDQHSYPITHMIPLELCYKIEWLLLDNCHSDGKEITKAFLRHHGININTADIPFINETQGEKQKIKEADVESSPSAGRHPRAARTAFLPHQPDHAALPTRRALA